jgi:hypothetical protein
MILDYQKVTHVFIVCGKTDLRKGIDGLPAIVQHEYNLDVYDESLFLFCGGRRDRFKMLYYEKDGFPVECLIKDIQLIRFCDGAASPSIPFRRSVFPQR